MTIQETIDYSYSYNYSDTMTTITFEIHRIIYIKYFIKQSNINLMITNIIDNIYSDGIVEINENMKRVIIITENHVSLYQYTNNKGNEHSTINSLYYI